MHADSTMQEGTRAALYCPVPPAGGAGALSGFQALQESCERVVVRTMATQVVTLLGAARWQPWLPTEPPRTALGHSSYVQELMKYLQVGGLSQTWLKRVLAENLRSFGHLWHKSGRRPRCSLVPCMHP